MPVRNLGWAVRSNGRDLSTVRRPQRVQPVSYDSLKKAELVELAEKRGIDTSGTKADIAARLTTPESNDADVTTTDG